MLELQSTKLSMHCQHAKGMSLRYTVIELGYRDYLRRLVAERFAPERLLRSAAPRRAELPRLPRC